MDPLDSLMSYAVAVMGKDTSWKERGLCLKVDGERKKWFLCGETDAVVVAGAIVPGRTAQSFAADICFNCPVQWECTRWAVEVGEADLVWGMHPRDFRWMIRNVRQPLGFIDTARAGGIPMRKAIDIARRARLAV